MIQDPPTPFTTDGCSGFMSFLWQLFTDKPPPWQGLCLVHDMAYWRGGPTHLRLIADRELRQGIRDKGHWYWAAIVYLGVRIGGPWWLPFPSVRRSKGKWHFAFDGVRWGYGWRYPTYQAG